MSTEKPKHADEHGAGRAAKNESEGQETPPAQKSGLDYVFKIAPADPKSSFDFEDVADK